MTRRLMGDTRALAGVVIDTDTAQARLRRDHTVELCRGHFPGEPFVPGAMLVGVMAELAGLLVDATGTAPAEVVRAVFARRVSPADDLVLVTARRDGRRVEAEVHVGEVRAAHAVFRFAERA